MDDGGVQFTELGKPTLPPGEPLSLQLQAQGWLPPAWPVLPPSPAHSASGCAFVVLPTVVLSVCFCIPGLMSSLRPMKGRNAPVLVFRWFSRAQAIHHTW